MMEKVNQSEPDIEGFLETADGAIREEWRAQGGELLFGELTDEEVRSLCDEVAYYEYPYTIAFAASVVVRGHLGMRKETL